MSITHAEKQVIVERIEARINTTIQQIETDHAIELRRIDAQVRAKALDNLEITGAVGEIAACEAEVKALEARIDAAKDLIHKAIGKDLSHYGYWANQFEIELKDRYALDLRAALKATDWGARINELKWERNNLVDTVLVATSSKELKGLWAKFNTLLGITPTAMEAEALAQPGAPETPEA